MAEQVLSASVGFSRTVLTSWTNSIHSDALGRKLLRSNLHEASNGKLAGRVCGEATHSLEPELGRDEDHSAALTARGRRNHRTDGRLEAEED